MLKSIFLTASLVACAPAYAQGNNCGPREIVLNHLSEGYGETRQSMGLGSDNSLVETFASDESGSWTITVTRPNGITCMVASGSSFENVEQEIPPIGEES